MTFPATAPGPNLPRARAVWVEVMDRRREWAWQAGDGGHFEDWPACNTDQWGAELEDALIVLQESLIGANEVDPRAATVDLIAVGSALIDAMDRPPTSG